MVQVFHGGSSAETELSLDKVGGGAGVAHEGYGIYFTTSDGLAETYRHPADGALLSADLNDAGFVSVHDAFDVLNFDVDDVVCAATGVDSDVYEDILDALRSGAPMGLSFSTLESQVREALIMYESALDLDDFLLEDGVAEAFESLRVMQLTEGDTVLDFYKALAVNMRGDNENVTDGERKASMFFVNKLDVPGFSYRDGRTESYGADVTNYVIFDLSRIKNVSVLVSPSGNGKRRGHKPA